MRRLFLIGIFSLFLVQGCTKIKGLFGKKGVGDPNDPDFLNNIQTLKRDIEIQHDTIKELQKQEMELKTSIDDIEFRKTVKTTPEVSVVPTLGLSESPFHKKIGVK